MRRCEWIVAAFVSLAFSLAFVACKRDNPNYCAEAGASLGYNCMAWDAALHDRHDSSAETSDAEDAADASDSGETGDAADGGADMAEVTPPICEMDMQCASKDAGTPACDLSDGGAKCVECTSNTHCQGSKPVCDTKVERCVECLGSGTECTADSSKSACNKTTQTCVQCVDNTKCTGTTPICETSTNKCRGCNADSECKGIGPEICVDWDGHCATNAEVVTLQGGAACTQSPLTGVFCKPSDALLARPVNGILLVKGPDAVGMIEPVSPGPTPGNMLILGRGGAVVAAGAGDTAGIHLSGAFKFWVRDIKVSGGTIGVLADFSTEVHLTRCTIILNPRGGIKTSTASFDITNTIVSGNGPGTDSGGVAWGGVRLGDQPSGGLARFENNTVIDNQSIGVSCASATYDVSTSIVHGNQGGESVGCSGVACCGANADPKVDSTLHLMSGSPCIDKLTATMLTPAVDIDGQPRPTAAGKLDCGADEFQ